MDERNSGLGIGENMNDQTTNIQVLKDAIKNFTEERKWGKAHSPKNLSMSIAIEAAELMEIFQWVDTDKAYDHANKPEVREHLGEEIADVMIYCLSLSNQLDMDVTTIIHDKIVKNGKKYPLPQA